MTTKEPNEIRELTEAQLDLVTGGSIAHEVTSSVKFAGAMAVLAFCYAYSYTNDYPSDPWA
jgi:hypothetical protein